MPELHRRPRPLTSLRQLEPGDGITAYCGCGRIVPLSVRKLQRRFPPPTNFATLAAKLVCQGTRKEPGCNRHSPSLLAFYDERVSWLYVSSKEDDGPTSSCPAPAP